MHVGYRLPRTDNGSGDQTVQSRKRLGADQVRVSALDKVTIDWEKHQIEPRWVESETAECVAALQPNMYASHGARERDRFLAGTAERREMALLISILGYAKDDTPHSSMQSGGVDSVYLADTNTLVRASRLPAKTRVTLARDLEPVDQDLAKRLLNRPSNAPWCGLQLNGLTLLPGGGGPPRTYPAVGQLQPLLLGPLSEPVVAVWVSPDSRIRWYCLPDDIDWNVILDWLIQQGIPAYVPRAARRYRTSTFIDTDLLTPAERDAQQALADMETRHTVERQRLQAVVDRARQAAEHIRDGLFYGKGDDLVRAVRTILSAAGFDVVDLDAELGRAASADLLVSLGDQRRLVEVKSEGRNASESLVNDLLKHLRTWPELRPELAAGGGALVVNHQYRLPPNERTRTVYSRAEFVATLSVQVVTVRDLYDWWRMSNWTEVQRAILGTEPPITDQTSPPSALIATAAMERTKRRSRWRFRRR